MLRYKQLWTVEATFRTAKHLLATRPIFHKLDETIRGHVFCSFLALVLKSELEQRIAPPPASPCGPPVSPCRRLSSPSPATDQPRNVVPRCVRDADCRSRSAG